MMTPNMPKSRASFLITTTFRRLVTGFMLAVIAALGDGCASFKVGNPTTSSHLVGTRWETVIDTVKSVDVSLAAAQQELVIADVTMSAEGSVTEHQTYEVVTTQKKIAVGAYPATRMTLDLENGRKESTIMTGTLHCCPDITKTVAAGCGIRRFGLAPRVP